MAVNHLVSGWRKYAALTAAARRTAATPGSEEVVELAAHRVASTHKPEIDVLVDDVRVATLRFELSIEFVIQGLVANVAHGDLVALRAGVAYTTTRLRVEGQEIIVRESKFRLPLVLRPGDGISLLGAPADRRGGSPLRLQARR